MESCRERVEQLEQINAIRRKYKQGDTISFYTQVYRHGESKMVKVEGIIDGIYKNGMQVSFSVKTGGETRWFRRWIAWKDILMAKGKGIYITAGHKDDYRGTGMK